MLQHVISSTGTVCDSARIVWLMLRIRIRIFFGCWIRILIGVKIWIRIRVKFKTQNLWRLKIEQCRPWTLTMESWRICSLVVSDSHHSEEELDTDPVRIEVKARSGSALKCKNGSGSALK